LPRFVFTWLQTSRNGDWTVADMGMLVAMLGIQKLVRNGWFDVSTAGAGLRIKLGERARKLREGKEPKPRAA
jgi:hypothetical protein